DVLRVAGMRGTATGLPWSTHFGHRPGELSGGSQGAGTHDRAGHRTGARLLAVASDGPGEVLCRPGVHDLGRVPPFPRIHAHVERPLRPEAEAARRIVEL